MTGPGEHNNEPLFFLKCRKFPDLQKTNKLCKTAHVELVKDSNLCNYRQAPDFQYGDRH